MSALIWQDYFPRVLASFGLEPRDLTSELRIILATNQVHETDRKSLHSAADAVLGDLETAGIVTAVIFDVLSPNDITALAPLANQPIVETTLRWKVVVVSSDGWRGFVMHRGTTEQYASRLRDEFEDLIHDLNQSG